MTKRQQEREQVLVRTMLKAELLKRQYKGTRGVRAVAIRAEMERRRNNTTEYYGAWGPYFGQLED